MSSATLLPLNNELLASSAEFPADLKVEPRRQLTEKVLQFGEGNFLRGFVDWMVHRMNTARLFNGSVVIVQPLASGQVPQLNAQNGLYTLALRGMQNGRVVEEKELITCVSRSINPYDNFTGFLQCAHNGALRYIVSNTTEAGIACDSSDLSTDSPPRSFPGKLTALMYERYRTFKGDPAKGFVMLPCELIERNGDALRRCVLQTARAWHLPLSFIHWIERHNVFCNTLVDRIVTGYPKEEAATFAQKLGYEDQLLDTGELFHAWIIEGPASLARELPFDRVGLNVVWTDNVNPYRDRKVRILNGAHTMTVLAAYLAGKNTVKECMDDATFSAYLRRGLSEEIIPTLDLPRAELDAFASAVCERFANPFVKHFLLSIALNSVSKFAARVLPSLKEYQARRGTLPKRLTFSLAALFAFYRGTELRDGALVGKRGKEEYLIKDSPAVLETIQAAWMSCDGSPAAVAKLTTTLLTQRALWHEDLTAIPGLAVAVAAQLNSILKNGAASTLAALET
ncbi:MAG: tagaturonate reductase [Nibricoccus sp.]